MYINDKIKQVLTLKQLSPSQLADTIGIQRSSISHILSGRNRPSLDIIQKIVRHYPEFNYEWFLEENSSLSTSPTTEESLPLINSTRYEESVSSHRPRRDTTSRRSVQAESINETIVPEKIVPAAEDKQIDRILIFYSDGTFSAYKPA